MTNPKGIADKTFSVVYYRVQEVLEVLMEMLSILILYFPIVCSYYYPKIKLKGRNAGGTGQQARHEGTISIDV